MGEQVSPCGAGCGYCGRCDASDGTGTRREIGICYGCGVDVAGGAVAAQQGFFCSTKCQRKTNDAIRDAANAAQHFDRR